MTSAFTVTTPATELSLLTIEELRAAAGLNIADDTADAVLLPLGRSASTAIARRCAVHEDGVNPPTLLQERCVETFRWARCGPIPLSRSPVTSVASVTLDGSAVDEESYETVGRNLYYLTSGDVASWASGKIIVTYDAGFAAAPSDLKLAASKLVTALYSETARDPSLKRIDIPGVEEREYWVAPSSDPLLTREISELIAPFRQMWL